MMYSEVEWRGYWDDIATMENLKRKYPDIETFFFGTDQRTRGLPGWIRYFRNPKQDFIIQEIYNRCSIYRCPSWTKVWLLPPTEVIACDCALFSTVIGGVKDYAIEGVTALLSSPNYPESLALRMEEFSRDDRKRIASIRNDANLIREFDWRKSALQLNRYKMMY